MKADLCLLTLVLVLSAQAAPAQDAAPWTPPPADDSAPITPEDQDPADLIGRGLGLLMDNFLREIQPELDRFARDLPQAAGEMAPILRDLRLLIDDLRNYRPPQRLENGDIIIRRRPDAPPPPPLELLPPAPEAQPSPDVPRVPVDPDAPEIEL